MLSWDDIIADEDREVIRVRREMERVFAGAHG